jgi:pyruvate kinase
MDFKDEFIIKKEEKKEEKKEDKKEEEEEIRSIKSINSLKSFEGNENNIGELEEDDFLQSSKLTKIVATLGPASNTPEIIKKLYEVGVNVFRLNFSHGTHESHGKMIDLIKSLKLNAAIMLDTKGPEIRIGEIRDKVHCKIGDTFILTVTNGVYEDTGKISVNYPGFIDDVDIEDIIVIDSGILQAEAIEKNDTDITFKVIEGECDITTKRHINLHGRPVSLPTVTEQDWKDIDFGIEKKVDFIALSFVRTAEDVVEVREYCQKKGVNIQIISKIENFESTQNLEDIIIESDGIMFARGDLSCEISYGEVPTMQKKVVSLCSYYNKPVIIATQMVLSMVTNIQHTRAEVSDIGNSIFEGADAIMTSDETTKSLNPVNVIKTMAKVVRETESNVYSICEKPECDDCFGVLHRGRLQRSGFESVNYYRKPMKAKGLQRQSTLDNRRKFSCTSIDMNPNLMKENIIHILPFVTDDIECLVAVHNHNDDYIKNIASSRLNIPMFGFTNNKMLCNQMNLIWNVQSVYDEKINEDYVNNMRRVDEFMKERDVIKYLLVGDLVTNGKKCTTIQVRNL